MPVTPVVLLSLAILVAQLGVAVVAVLAALASRQAYRRQLEIRRLLDQHGVAHDRLEGTLAELRSVGAEVGGADPSE